MPDITIPSDIKVKVERLMVTPAGVKMYTLDFSEYDVVRVSLIFNAGTKYQSVPFSASSVANMLSEGCEGYTAQEIADFIDFYGIYFDQTVDADYVVVTICSLERFFDKSLEILSKIIASPQFPVEELEIHKSRRKQAISVARAKIDYAAREQFMKALYSDEHYYGRSYNENMYDTLTVEDLKSFYAKYYTRENLFVVASGKVTDEHLAKLSLMVDALPQGVKAKCDSHVVTTRNRVEVAWKESSQSAIRIGRILFPRTHPDFIAVQMLATVLGGYFGSRLISNLREEKGYTYGIFAGVMNMQDAGHFAISTEVEHSVTEDAISEIFAEIDRLRCELVPAEELDMVKNVMIGEILRVLDGPFGIADVTIENILSAQNNEQVHRHVAEIRSMTSERIMEMAQKYFKREDFVTVIVSSSDEESK